MAEREGPATPCWEGGCAHAGGECSQTKHTARGSIRLYLTHLRASPFWLLGYWHRGGRHLSASVATGHRGPKAKSLCLQVING